MSNTNLKKPDAMLDNSVEQHTPNGKTMLMSLDLSVSERLSQLAQWQHEWAEEKTKLDQYFRTINPDNPAQSDLSDLVANERTRIAMRKVFVPFEMSEKGVGKTYGELRQRLERQYVCLSKADRILWLTNFNFILTPELRTVDDKITEIRSADHAGKSRNFLLGGESGMGKSTYLDWLCFLQRPTIEPEVNHLPIIKLQAPNDNRSAKPLYRRILLQYGHPLPARTNEDQLFNAILYFVQKCSTEIMIVDEILHLKTHELRRRLLEISNELKGHGFGIICAAVNPMLFTLGDKEIEGRWRAHHILQPFRGERLDHLLEFIDLLLPFEADSYLRLRTSPTNAKSGEKRWGPANWIEEWTQGILRDIMDLIVKASHRAIQRGLSKIHLDLLVETWEGMRHGDAKGGDRTDID